MVYLFLKTQRIHIYDAVNETKNEQIVLSVLVFILRRLQTLTYLFGLPDQSANHEQTAVVTVLDLF